MGAILVGITAVHNEKTTAILATLNPKIMHECRHKLPPQKIKQRRKIQNLTNLGYAGFARRYSKANYHWRGNRHDGLGSVNPPLVVFISRLRQSIDKLLISSDDPVAGQGHFFLWLKISAAALTAANTSLLLYKRQQTESTSVCHDASLFPPCGITTLMKRSNQKFFRSTGHSNGY